MAASLRICGSINRLDELLAFLAVQKPLGNGAYLRPPEDDARAARDADGFITGFQITKGDSAHGGRFDTTLPCTSADHRRY